MEAEMADVDDAVFAAKLLKSLPTTAVSSSLEARILADFDRLAIGRGEGWAARLVARWSDKLWPGAPLWQPASALALSLIIGLAAGAFVPAATSSTADQSFAVADTSSVMDLYKDL
jgi:hypothetical protein